MKARKLLTGSSVVLTSAFLVACGSQPAPSNNSASSSATSGSDSSANLKYVQSQIDEYKKLPQFTPPGPAFDAKKLMAGKTIISIPSSSAVPFVENIEKTMEKVAKDVGVNFEQWQNQGQPSQWAQGMSYAINKKADVIDLLAGINPAVLQPQIEAAKKAGIQVVTSHLTGYEQSVPYVSHNMAVDYNKAGRLLADWTISKTQGKPDVLVVTINEVVSTEPMVSGLKDEFAKYAPDAKVSYVNIPLADWSKMQTEVQSAILKDPNLNYVIPLYDSMSPNVVAGITTAGATNRVKVATYNGTPFVLKMIQDGKVEMDIGENIDWIGRAIMDDEMRLAAGLPFADNENIPMYIWDKSNISQAGNPPQLSQGYGDAYVAGYNKLWGLTQ